MLFGKLPAPVAAPISKIHEITQPDQIVISRVFPLSPPEDASKTVRNTPTAQPATSASPPPLHDRGPIALTQSLLDELSIIDDAVLNRDENDGLLSESPATSRRTASTMRMSNTHETTTPPTPRRRNHTHTRTDSNASGTLSNALPVPSPASNQHMPTSPAQHTTSPRVKPRARTQPSGGLRQPGDLLPHRDESQDSTSQLNTSIDNLSDRNLTVDYSQVPRSSLWFHRPTSPTSESARSSSSHYRSELH
jgi:hypothetical protein